MTGFRNRLSVARCCCNCEDCCNGAYPTEWDLSLAITDSTCTTCNETLDGTYSLTFGGAPYTGLGTCSWGYYWRNLDYSDITSCLPASGPYSYDGIGWADRYIKLRVTCISATQYWVNVVVGISAYPNYYQSYSGSSQRFIFSEYVDVADWPCDEVTDYCIPLTIWEVSGPLPDYWTPWTWRPWTGPSDLYKKLCEPPTEICLTAIP